MNMTKALAFLSALLLLTWVCPARSVEGAASATKGQAFEHTPFPSIPSTTIPENKLMEILPKACKKLAEQDELAPQLGCPAAQGELTDDELRQLAQGLKQACQHLDTPDAVVAQDVECFRIVRDDPVRRDAIDKWSDETFALDKLAEARENAGAAASNVPLSASSATSLADSAIRGLAEFLAKRAQQEALAYLREQLATKLCTNLGHEFFPRVCRAIEELEAEQSLESIGALMRAAARADLKELPDVTLDYVGITHPTLANHALAGRVGYSVYREMTSGRSPTEVIANLGDIELDRCRSQQCNEAAKLVQATSALAFALLQAGPKNQWLTNLEGQDSKFYAAAMVAVVLLAEARTAATKSALGDKWVSATIVKITAVESTRLVEAFRQAQSNFQQLEDSLTGDDALKGRDKRARIGEVLRGASEALAQQVNVTAKLLGTSNGAAVQWGESLQAVGAITADLLDDKYAEAIVRFGVFFKRQLAATSADENLTQLRRYLPLIVEIAAAQNSEGVAAAFDAYAAPLGTYQTKYRRNVVAINGMVGLLGGWEAIDTRNVSGGSAFLAGFAPVGVHATFVGDPDGEANLFHFGVMLSVLDLGALTTHRFEREIDEEPEAEEPDDADPEQADVEQQPNISFAQVFSPGAYLTLGICGSPFIFGAGLSYAPELRTVTDGATEFEASALRYGAFLAVDIPILPFN